MKSATTKKILPAPQAEALLGVLQQRFEQNPARHVGLAWAKVQAKLSAHPTKLWSLNEMEQTGGEPDVVGHDAESGEFIFMDCSAQSPDGRQSLCYDRAALESRKEPKPRNSVIDLATAMGVELLDEAQYRALQQLGEFDTKTSSWLKSPAAIRQLGGAIFGDRRFGHIWVYHNGAQSYYAGRGFRAALRV